MQIEHDSTRDHQNSTAQLTKEAHPKDSPKHDPREPQFIRPKVVGLVTNSKTSSAGQAIVHALVQDGVQGTQQLVQTLSNLKQLENQSKVRQFGGKSFKGKKMSRIESNHKVYFNNKEVADLYLMTQGLRGLHLRKGSKAGNKVVVQHSPRPEALSHVNSQMDIHNDSNNKTSFMQSGHSHSGSDLKDETAIKAEIKIMKDLNIHHILSIDSQKELDKTEHVRLPNIPNIFGHNPLQQQLSMTPPKHEIVTKLSPKAHPPHAAKK